MNLDSLKFFLRTAELGSVTKAALSLGTVQPIVSRSIAQLEREIGSRLFQRTGHGVQLTPLGETLLPRAKLIVLETENFIAESQSYVKTPAGEVRIGVLTSFATSLVPALLKQAAAKFPDVRLKIYVGTVARISDWLEEGKIEIAFNFGDGQLLGDAQLLGNLEVCLIGKKESAIKDMPSIDFNRLGDILLILAPTRSHVRKKIDILSEELSVNLNIFMEVDTSRLQLKLVEEGYGYTIMPRLTLQQQGLEGDFVLVPIINPRITLQVMVGTSTRSVPSLATREITKLLGEIGQNIMCVTDP